MNIRPILKAPVSIQNQPAARRVFVGTRWRRCAFPDDWAGSNPRRILELFDGKRSVHQIAQQAGVEESLVLALVEELRKHDFIDLERTPISYLRRYNPEIGRIDYVSDTENIFQDYAVEAFLNRMEIECDAATLSPGDIDAGRSSVIKRREFSILIFGHGKIVNALVGVLSASGFSKLAVINRVGSKHPSLKIQESDIAGSFISRSDIGQVRKNVVEEIRKSSALIAEPKIQIHKPDLIISVGNPAPDAIQRWMSDQSRHLLIDIPSSAEVRVGPMVIPGKTACFRCIQLSENFNSHENLITENPVRDVGSALSLSVASAIALDLIAFADRQESLFLATSLIYSMRHYQQPEIQRWSQHHACGCAWN
ncbi:MAG: hypothetical protein RL421_282 [Actinomycetota bacterium]|jgi:hypothetical protein